MLANDDWKKLTRRSIRLQEYDYSQAGAYYVTICTQGRRHLFGEILQTPDETIYSLNDGGKVAEQCWNEIPQHYPNVALDEFIVMPNHVHGIVVINQADCGAMNDVGANDHSPLQMFRSRPSGTSKTIGAIVRGFKIGVTKWFRKNTDIQVVWQRNYYEHVIRAESDLDRVRKYIIENPFHWAEDENNR